MKRFGRQLARLFDKRNGICMYCDGATWLPTLETKTAASMRLGIPALMAGSAKMLRDAEATREHLKRRIDGGNNHVSNIGMACQACNSRRDVVEPDVHRIDMQVLVAAGLHPVNRPRVIDDPIAHRKRGLKALKALRAGISISQQHHQRKNP